MPFEITIPRLGWSMEEGTFAGWMKKDGDVIRRGDALFELEGEKALQEIEALDDGVLRIPADGPQPGAVLKVGAVIGYLLAEGEALAAAPDPAAYVCDRSDDSASNTKTTDIRSAANRSASPSVRRLARELAVDLTARYGNGHS